MRASSLGLSISAGGCSSDRSFCFAASSASIFLMSFCEDRAERWKGGGERDPWGGAGEAGGGGRRGVEAGNSRGASAPSCPLARFHS